MSGAGKCFGQFLKKIRVSTEPNLVELQQLLGMSDDLVFIKSKILTFRCEQKYQFLNGSMSTSCTALRFICPWIKASAPYYVI